MHRIEDSCGLHKAVVQLERDLSLQVGKAASQLGMLEAA